MQMKFSGPWLSFSTFFSSSRMHNVRPSCTASVAADTPTLRPSAPPSCRPTAAWRPSRLLHHSVSPSSSQRSLCGIFLFFFLLVLFYIPVCLHTFSSPFSPFQVAASGGAPPCISPRWSQIATLHSLTQNAACFFVSTGDRQEKATVCIIFFSLFLFIYFYFFFSRLGEIRLCGFHPSAHAHARTKGRQEDIHPLLQLLTSTLSLPDENPPLILFKFLRQRKPRVWSEDLFVCDVADDAPPCVYVPVCV